MLAYEKTTQHNNEHAIDKIMQHLAFAVERNRQHEHTSATVEVDTFTLCAGFSVNWPSMESEVGQLFRGKKCNVLSIFF